MALQVGEFAVTEKIGQGGMGVVYRGVSRDGSSVAIKVLRVESGFSEAAKRFEREKRLLATFGEADGFVPLLDAGESVHGPWLAMPFVAGGTLQARLRAKRFTIEEATRVARDLAHALARAHGKGVVHRDLKPSNVLLAADGRALVADLGIAKHFGASIDARSASLSKSGMLRGTPGYMAPEQMRDAKSVGPAADVFAFGAIVYECLAGKPAFRGETGFELLAKVQEGIFEPLDRACPGAPGWLVAVVHRALARSPEERFADGAALLRALESRSAGRGRSRGVRLGLLASVVLLAGGALTWRAARSGRPELPGPESVRAAEVAALLSATARVVPFGLPADVAAAISNASRLIAADPREAAPWMCRAMLRADQADKSATDDAEKAFELDPRSPLVHLARARARFLKHDCSGARADAEEATRRAPSSATAWAVLGRIETDEHARDLPAALALAAKAIALDPRCFEGHLAALMAHFNAKSYAEAVRVSETALPLATTNRRRREVLLMRTASLAALSKWKETIASAEELTKVEGPTEDPESWNMMAAAKASLDDNLGVVEALDRALERKERPDLLSNRASFKVKLKDGEGAVRDATRATELAPRDKNAWKVKGDAHAAAAQFEEAEVAFLRAIDLDGTDADTWLRRGLARSYVGDFDAAIAHYGRALELGKRVDFYSSRAYALTRKGDIKAAREDLDAALAMDAEHVPSRMSRAAIRYGAGEMDGAIEDFEVVVRVAPPESFEAMRARQNLEMLRRR